MVATTSSTSVRPWVAPLLTAGAGVAGATYLVLQDPAEGGAFVPCPFHAATGWWCPGCGITRATHHLLRGDLPGAVARNPFAPVLVGLLAWAWLAWAVPRARPGRRVPTPGDVLRPAWTTTLLVLLVAFGVARNLPLPSLDALAP